MGSKLTITRFSFVLIISRDTSRNDFFNCICLRYSVYTFSMSTLWTRRNTIFLHLLHQSNNVLLQHMCLIVFLFLLLGRGRARIKCSIEIVISHTNHICHRNMNFSILSEVAIAFNKIIPNIEAMSRNLCSHSRVLAIITVS